MTFFSLFKTIMKQNTKITIFVSMANIFNTVYCDSDSNYTKILFWQFFYVIFFMSSIKLDFSFHFWTQKFNVLSILAEWAICPLNEYQFDTLTKCIYKYNIFNVKNQKVSKVHYRFILFFFLFYLQNTEMQNLSKVS